MNEKIKDIKLKIDETKKLLKELENELIFQIYCYYESIGIKRGDIVSVKSFGDKYKNGIFSHIYIEYGNVRPRIMKITKTGKAHSTASIYCYSLKDMCKYGNYND